MRTIGVGLGRHVIAELYECDSNLLDDVRFIEYALVEAAKATNSTILHYKLHRFKPHGVSGYVLVAESHLSIHTWPEYGYAAIDIFTCGRHTDPVRGLEVLRALLKAKRVSVIEISRGMGVAAEYEGYWRPQSVESRIEINREAIGTV